MTLTEKKDLYRAKFPAILAERMREQMDENVPSFFSITCLVNSFAIWSRTKEGFLFWNEIQFLYRNYNPPTTSQIQEVFKRHGIEYNVG